MARRSWKVRMGKLIRVPNKARRAGANESYLLTKVQLPGGKENYVLLTDHQIKVAINRAGKNPEDVIETVRLMDLVD